MLHSLLGLPLWSGEVEGAVNPALWEGGLSGVRSLAYTSAHTPAVSFRAV